MIYLDVKFMLVTKEVENDCINNPNCDKSPFTNYMKILGWISAGFYLLLTLLLIIQFFKFNKVLNKIFERYQINQITKTTR